MEREKEKKKKGEKKARGRCQLENEISANTAYESCYRVSFLVPSRISMQQAFLVFQQLFFSSFSSFFLKQEITF